MLPQNRQLVEEVIGQSGLQNQILHPRRGEARAEFLAQSESNAVVVLE